MSFQSSCIKGHDNFHHFEKKTHEHVLFSDLSIRTIRKIKRTKESLNARLSNHVKFDRQGRIHGNPVADGWAGAVMQRPLAIQKCDLATD